MSCHLISRRLGLSLLSVLLVALALLGALTIRHPQAHAAGAGLTLSPASGKPNTLIHVKGSGFASHETVVITLNNLTLVTTTSNEQGTMNTTFFVPLIVPGNYLVQAQGQGPDQTTLSAPFTILPFTTITLPTKSVAPGNQLIVKGAGFLPNEPVQLTFGPTAEPQAQADASGKFIGGFTIPASTPLGSYTVQATGEQSGFSASASLLLQSQWSSFGYDVHGDRSNPHENTLSPTTVSTLTPLWHFATGSQVISSPAVVNGVAYVGSDDGNVYALNAHTGALLWHFATGQAVRSSPAVSNGVVYVGSMDSNVYALDASTGVLLWRFTTGSFILSSPAVANGVVYIGSFDANVYALNASTGALLWRFPTGGGVFPVPTVANGVVYIGSNDHNVYALAAATGSKLWSYDAGSFIDTDAAVVNGVVYVGTDDAHLDALNARTGALLWSFAAGVFIESSPAVANGIIYFGGADQLVYALNASTGALLWSFPTGDQVNSSPAVANGVVYVGSDDAHLYALDASTGALLWSFATGSFVDSSPAVVNGVVYVGSVDAKLYAFTLPGLS